MAHFGGMAMRMQCPAVLMSMDALLRLAYGGRPPKLDSALLESITELLLNCDSWRGRTLAHHLLSTDTLSLKRDLVKKNLGTIKRLLQPMLEPFKGTQ